MAGTVLKSLSVMATTSQADNTPATAATTGFSAVGFALNTNGNTAVHLAAAKMGATAGLAITQTGATGTPLAYIDLDAAVSIYSFFIPFNSDNVALFSGHRGFANVDHTGALWTAYFTAGLKLQFTEATSGGANLISTNAVPSNTDCVMVGLINGTANTYTVRVYQLGTTNVLAEVTGALTTSGANATVRSSRVAYGTNNSATGSRVYLNNLLAVGRDDYLARTDITTAALALTASLTPTGSPSTADTAVSRTLTINATGGSGNSFAVTVDWGDGLTADSTTMVPGTAKTLSRTPSVAGSKTITITYPTAG